MFQSDQLHEPERRDNGHDYWLAMQSAYAEYRAASEALESANALSGTEPLRAALLEGQQRGAFERYLEARMAFLEIRFDEVNLPKAEAAPPEANEEYSGIRLWLEYANRKPVLQILAAILLCMTAFSLVRERKLARDLEAGRVELRAALDQVRDGATSTLARDGGAPATRIDTGWSEAGAAQPSRPTTVPTPKKKTAVKKAPSRQTPNHVNARAYRNFSLAPSRQFKRVGQIQVAVRSVDAERKGASSVSLSILSDRVKMEVESLHLNQPVWIKVGNRQEVLGLVIDRIARNRLDGHLIEPQT